MPPVARTAHAPQYSYDARARRSERQRPGRGGPPRSVTKGLETSHTCQAAVVWGEGMKRLCGTDLGRVSSSALPTEKPRRVWRFLQFSSFAEDVTSRLCNVVTYCPQAVGFVLGGGGGEEHLCRSTSLILRSWAPAPALSAEPLSPCLFSRESPGSVSSPVPPDSSPDRPLSPVVAPSQSALMPDGSRAVNDRAETARAPFSGHALVSSALAARNIADPRRADGSSAVVVNQRPGVCSNETGAAAFVLPFSPILSQP
ncbi:hypothetical protein AAFF_G00058600 [Aldrovandia affinis]|uniref:Uncharacterized protein n=1 Tax=Aldrovandia affinis TaxID=143900 RepID=A0AAD7WE00_9TELE|nr:hypothetical protein AAFF_G00058600 [Aldrovandia affinis]